MSRAKRIHRQDLKYDNPIGLKSGSYLLVLTDSERQSNLVTVGGGDP